MKNTCEMKDSGYPDLGRCPKHWQVEKIKNAFVIVCGATPTEDSSNWDGEVIWVGPADMGDFGRISKGKRTLTSKGYSSCGTTLVPKGSVILSTRAPIGKIQLAEVELCTNQGCKALVPKTDKHISAFGAYFLFAIKERLQILGTGTTFKELSTANLANIPYFLPPPSEQSAIASYLDDKCGAIDSIIAETKSTIEEYKRWRASVIFEAVTKGLDKNAEMKDSGVDWIGKIPKGWKVSSVHHHFSITLGKMLCSENTEPDNTYEFYLCAANVHFGKVDFAHLKQMWFSPLEKRMLSIANGDLVVVEGGAGAGGAAIIENIPLPACFQNSILRVRGSKTGCQRYLRYLLEMLVKQGYIDFVCNKATIPHFTKEKLGEVPLPLPPLSEQSAIANYLDSKCGAIDGIIAEKEKLITELEAYRKSLIFEVVTGKRRVC